MVESQAVIVVVAFATMEKARRRYVTSRCRHITVGDAVLCYVHETTQANAISSGVPVFRVMGEGVSCFRTLGTIIVTASSLSSVTSIDNSHKRLPMLLSRFSGRATFVTLAVLVMEGICPAMAVC